MLAICLFSFFCAYSGWRHVMNIAVPCSCFGLLFRLPPTATFFVDSCMLAACTAALRIVNRMPPVPTSDLAT